MTKIVTLRNIITLLASLFFMACRTNNGAYYNSSGALESVSSEDNKIEVTAFAELRNPETGQTIYFVTKNE